MTVSSVHLPERTAAQGFSRIGRLAVTILCLAGVVVLTVVLRSGLYEYFHGGGWALRSLAEVLMTTVGGLSLVEIAAVGLLGLVTTKHGELEQKDALKRRIDEAAQFVDLDQLCLSPQCGFSSTLEGNDLSFATSCS